MAGPHKDLLICFMGMVMPSKEEDFAKTLKEVLEETCSRCVDTADPKVPNQIKELQGAVQALALTVEMNTKE